MPHKGASGKIPRRRHGDANPKRPLSGIRVIDFSHYAPAAYAAVMLADLGADVVRIDRIGTPHPGKEDGLSRGKRAIAIDLKQPMGLKIAYELIRRSDVLVEGFRPGVMERLGLGPKAALRKNAGLVYARVTGWGQTGPLARRAGHEINYMAIAGILALIGRSSEAPLAPPALLGDFAAGGLMAAFGIVSALYWRERSGLGQVIDSAMVDGLVNLGSYFLTLNALGDWTARGTNEIDSGAPYYDVYATSDQRWLAVGALEPQFYTEFVRGLGLNPADIPSRHDRGNWPRLREQFGRIIRQRSLSDWTAEFAGRDACVTPVLELAEIGGHPQNVARRVPRGGPRGLPRPPPAPRFSGSPATTVRPEPNPARDARAILSTLGYKGRKVTELIDNGVVGLPLPHE